MLRVDALQAIYPDIKDQIVVTIMGAVAAELYTIGHRPNFFYLEHAMGLASSMGLGIALSKPRHKVVVIDGDGSLLMNLGTLSTMARYRPRNLVHIVFDNQSLLSVGGFPTATATGTDLAGVARACAIPEVAEADTPERLKQAVAGALAGGTLTTVVAKVEAGEVDEALEIERVVEGRTGRMDLDEAIVDRDRLRLDGVPREEQFRGHLRERQVRGHQR